MKGGDYTIDTLPEVDQVERLGGSVQILPYVDDHSTSGIIERVRETADAAPDDAWRASAGVRLR